MDFGKLVGTEIGGYEITQMLGEGGMAVVFRAENMVNRRLIRALKIVRPELASRKEFQARFSEEAITLERLAHPNVVRFYGLRRDGELLIMELEYLDGQALSSIVRTSPTPPAIRDAVRWIHAASLGVASAHSMGIVHRDLKPDNLFLTKDGTIKVLDFGIARAVDDADRESRLTTIGTVPGSPPYMAPEVCEGGVPEASADVYALGISLFEVLIGHHPFAPPGTAFQSSIQWMKTHVSRDVPRLRDVRKDAPAALETLIAKATAKDPKVRYRDGAELAEALGAIVATLGGGVSKPEISTQFTVPALNVAGTPRATETTKAGRSNVGMVVGIVATLLVVGVGAMFYAQSAAPPATEGGSAEPSGDSDAGATRGESDPAAVPVLNRWIAIPAAAEDTAPLGVSLAHATSDWAGFRPSRDVHAPGNSFEIQQHEVTWGEAQPFLDAHPVVPPLARPAWAPTGAAGDRYPVTGLSWNTARAYCASLDARLPTEEEWEWAARRSETGLRANPWGTGRVDLDRTHAYAGPAAHVAEVMTYDQDRTPGTHDTSLYDMLGNAQEWTVDLYRDDLPDQDETWVQTPEITYRAVRGFPLSADPPGSIQEEGLAYRDSLCASGQCPGSIGEVLQQVGFRCVR